MSRQVLMTGVSSGIGLALGRHLLERGDQVWGISRRVSPLQGLPGFTGAQADLTDPAQTARALSGFTGQFSSLDLVVLNAGRLGRIAGMREVPIAELEQLMAVNVWANKTVIDLLGDAGIGLRQVVAISSGASVRGNRGWNGYAISKAALNMLVQLYAAEQPETHWLALAPGLVDTAMQEYLCGLPPDERFASLAALRQRRGTGEMPTPEQLAPRLAEVIFRAPGLAGSGQFLDLRDVATENPPSDG